MAQVRLVRVITIHACALVSCVVVVFSSPVSVLYFVPPFSFQPFQMSTSAFNERSRSNPLCDFRLGTVVTSDHETPLTVPEARVPVVECLDGLARITLEELAITHFVKDGTLQNACTTRPRVVAGLRRSAHSHIVRSMNSRRKSPNRIMTKVLWLC